MYYSFPWSQQQYILFFVMVLGTTKLDLHKTNVLVSISFGLLDLFDYRREKYQLLRRSMSNEIDFSLHWVTHLFFTCIYIPVLVLCLSLICEISPKLFLYPACRLIVWEGNGKCLHRHLSHCQNSRKFHFAALERVIEEMNNIHYWSE